MAEMGETHFQRLNFFRGFRTTEADWNAGERYHVDKRKLHNRMLHGPGVVADALGGLQVRARGRGELAVDVQPGYAVDGQGNDLMLWTPQVVPFHPADFKLPGTVHLVLRYVEEFSDFVAYPEHPDFKGHRRIRELATLTWTMAAPDSQTDVELCRVAVSQDVRRLVAPRDPHAPGLDEVDTRFVPLAGTAGTRLSPQLHVQALDALVQAKPVYAWMAHKLALLPAADVLHALTTLEMVWHVGHVDLRNVFALQRIVLDHERVLVQALQAEHPQISGRREFAAIHKQAHTSLRRLDEGVRTVEALEVLVAARGDMTALWRSLFAQQMASVSQLQARAVETNAAVEAIRVRSEAFEERLLIEGLDLVRVDAVDPLDADSERAHKWKISQERDKYRTRQKLKYPDGVVVEDAGVAFEGGELTWELGHIEPDRDVYLIWRTDYAHGDWEAEVEGNGRRLPNAVCAGNDRKHRWRNWVYIIAAEHVTETTLAMKWTPLTAGRDVNVFKMWAYQPVRRA